MSRVKSFLANAYNNLYDLKLHFASFVRWRKDLRVQEKLGLPNIMSIDETLDRVIDKKLSICRYGDGEFSLMDGGRIHFQQHNGSMASRLREICIHPPEDILVCIPSFLDRRHKIIPGSRGMSPEEKKCLRQATRYLDDIVAKRRKCWLGYFDFAYSYGNTQVSRFYSTFYDHENSERWIRKWKQVWDKRDLLIVEGDKTRLGVGNDLFANAESIRRILAPAIDAFDRYDEILAATLIESNSDDLILVALGPTATILACDLAQEGCQALDVGHIDIQYEWFLRRRPYQKVEGKFTSDVSGGTEVDDICADKSYMAQIVQRIV